MFSFYYVKRVSGLFGKNNEVLQQKKCQKEDYNQEITNIFTSDFAN